ncbi:MAG TPA: anhydro-N-acetylmuramic acid kinase, partial [Pirellulales bacterium]|nr:anhydro-N-acetylmuramic acid kinase [Pirellulales bacterium]
MKLSSTSQATDWLRRLAELRERPAVVVGVLSGTSADGIDVAVCRVTPTSERCDGLGSRVELLRHFCHPHDPQIQQSIANSNAFGARRLSELDRSLGRRFAEACMAAITSSGLVPEKVDLIGSHGQTLYHHSRVPGAMRCGLQLGDGDEIAELTSLPVVSDFRARDIAAGGEGAPITPIADLVLFRSFGPHGRRAVLNLGGIANVTVLDDDPSRILGFDIGPGNALLDRLVRRLTKGERNFDVDGRLASAGNVNRPLLDGLLADDVFLKQPPPKSTGFEMYGDAMVEQLERRHGRLDADLLATAAEFTAQAIARALSNLLDERLRPGEIVVAGGGALNPDLVRRIAEAVAPRIVTPSDDLG